MMLGALEFLTVLPVRASSDSPGAAAAWFPVVGVLLGLVAAAALQLPLGAVLALIMLAAITGGLHEDGLADVCDAVRGYRTRERMIEILHDSRIGAHGAVAIAFSILLRWQALSHLTGDPWFRLPAALALSRGAMVILAAWSPAAGTGLGRRFHDTIPRWAPWLVIVQLIAVAALVGWPAALWLLIAQATAILFVRIWLVTRLGGITGDGLGFLCQLSEAASLVVMTWI
jgi:adenosylcobinamide-GDP ribazoletransferase